MAPDEFPRWVWEDPRRLSCPDEWRITARPADGVATYRDDRHIQTVVFGRSEHFQSGERVEAVLRLLGSQLRLDPRTWKDQEKFYKAFVQSLYSGGDGSTPAWIKIAPTRLSFRERMQTAKATAEEKTTVRKVLFHRRYLGHETLSLNNQCLSTRGVQMVGRPEAREKHLKLYQMTVHRTIQQDGFGRPVENPEDWIFLGTSADEERAARKRGQNLTLRAYPDADPLGRMSPLVSLCRMSKDRRWIYSRCVSLRPGVGDALDFRSVTHSTPFYFRSELSNAALIGQATTSGSSERFTHG